MHTDICMHACASLPSEPLDSGAGSSLIPERHSHAAVGALPAAARVKEEVMGALKGWEDSGRFEPIREQVAAHPDLKWTWP